MSLISIDLKLKVENVLFKPSPESFIIILCYFHDTILRKRFKFSLLIHISCACLGRIIRVNFQLHTRTVWGVQNFFPFTKSPLLIQFSSFQIFQMKFPASCHHHRVRQFQRKWKLSISKINKNRRRRLLGGVGNCFALLADIVFIFLTQSDTNKRWKCENSLRQR